MLRTYASRSGKRTTAMHIMWGVDIDITEKMVQYPFLKVEGTMNLCMKDKTTNAIGRKEENLKPKTKTIVMMKKVKEKGRAR